MQQARRHGGAYRGRAPQITACAPKKELCLPNGDCAPKKVAGWVPLKCSSRPETPKMLVITPEFVNKNCFFADFVIKTLFLWFHPGICENSRIFCNKELFFVFTPEFVEIRAYFETMKVFFLVYIFGKCQKCRPKKRLNAKNVDQKKDHMLLLNATTNPNSLTLGQP